MKYTINLDEDNYILSISNTDNDDTELDLDKMELDYLNAYQLIDGKAILNATKKAEIIAENTQLANNDRIIELKQLLTESDYILAKMMEEVLALTNPLTFIADFIKIMASYSTKYKEQIANRKSWRKEIEELEND